ncbi:MAG: UDP-N-acetylmuramoyl-L-alanine--D-glutamate ligase [Gemmatimonadetes bacterium]|nr:UDP-N-acetylmuramoyl-L-alanine--D-glutamate ligase [Gemmatimonadota bacterium]
MIPEAWRRSEVAVIGLARSGKAACLLLRRHGLRVYGSDQAESVALVETAAELRAEGCEVRLDGHDLGRIARAALVVLSPGVPPHAEPVVAATGAGVPVISELDLAARFLEGSRLIVTTGTKGKSTTSAIVAHVLGEAGLGPAAAAGNIGRPLSDLALAGPPPSWLSVEASSFQLHDCPELRPAVGVLTNLSADHLDRYASVEAYYADKALLFRHASPESRWVVNGDDRAVLSMTAAVPGVQERFSLERRAADGFFDRAAGWLALRGIPLLRRADLALLGDHNVTNALAALLALPPELDREILARALGTFRPLPHRLEPVREVGGVLWVNDSKATTVSSCLSAIRSIERPVVLVVGGKDKGGDFTELRSALRGARAVVAYGEAEPLVAKALDGAIAVVRGGRDFPAVIARARELAKPGDAVLLSPACASFDMFTSAEDRGRQFRTLVEEM